MPRTRHRIDEYALITGLILAGLKVAHDLLPRLWGGTVLIRPLLLLLGFPLFLATVLALWALEQLHPRDRRALAAAVPPLLGACRALPGLLLAFWRWLRRADDVAAHRLREGLRVTAAWLRPRLVRAGRRLLAVPEESDGRDEYDDLWQDEGAPVGARRAA